MSRLIEDCAPYATPRTFGIFGLTENAAEARVTMRLALDPRRCKPFDYPAPRRLAWLEMDDGRRVRVEIGRCYAVKPHPYLVAHVVENLTTFEVAQEEIPHV